MYLRDKNQIKERKTAEGLLAVTDMQLQISITLIER